MKKIIIFMLTVGVLCVTACGKERVDNIKIHPILKKFTPPIQSFSINPSIQNVVTGKRGTRLYIPPKAFDIDYDDLKKNKNFKVQLTEYIDTFDFLTSGVSLRYHNPLTKRAEVFESAGMFKVTATYKGKKTKLKKNKGITVEFPNVVPGEKFNVYRINSSGQWEYDGHNQESIPKRKSSSRFKMDVEIKRLNPVAYKRIVGVRKYVITSLTYYNFDYPRPESACVKGLVKIDNQKKKRLFYQVYILPLKTRGYWRNHSSVKQFKVSYFNNTKVKLMILTSDGRIGKSRIFWTSPRFGHHKKKEGPHCYCKKSGKVIRLKKIDDSILKSRKKFMKYLGLKGDEYTVKRKK